MYQRLQRQTRQNLGHIKLFQGDGTSELSERLNLVFQDYARIALPAM